MAAIKTTKKARAADGGDFALAILDESGDGSGPFDIVRASCDSVGNLINPATAEGIAAVVAALGGGSGLGYPASGKTPVTTPFAAPATVTITIATPGVISWATHGLAAGTGIKFATTGALPTGLVAGTVYYVSSAGLVAGSFQVAATYAAAIAGTGSIATSGSQSGTQTAWTVYSPYFPPLAGRAFNISLVGTVGDAVQLERSFDSGTTSEPLTAAGTQLCVWTAAASESWEEAEVGVMFRLNRATGTAGVFTTRISQ